MNLIIIITIIITIIIIVDIDNCPTVQYYWQIDYRLEKPQTRRFRKGAIEKFLKILFISNYSIYFRWFDESWISFLQL